MMERSYMNFDNYQLEVIKSMQNTLVIAGPGSGKTTTILDKVRFLLKENPTASILLLSFTNKSVNDIQKKLSDESIDVMTFHKLAIDILKHYNYQYHIVDDTLLPYIIDEYFNTLSISNKQKLCRYLNVLRINKQSNEYKSLKKLIITFINLFKTNNHDINILHNLITNYEDRYLLKIILDILNIYEEEKNSCRMLDFDDLIIQATKLLENDYQYKKYDYIIIDEFQDTSLIRLNLIKEIYYHSNAVITAVGDDAQSIFHFTGCDLNIFLNFQDHFPNSNLIFLKNTYRNSQEIVDISEKFINKNPNQLVKNMHSNIHIQDALKIIYYYHASKSLKKTLDLIKSDNIMILSRNYNDIYNYLDDEITIQDNLIYYQNKTYKYLTIHSSKGLESDYVIILNNANSLYGLPNKLEDHPILKYITGNDNEIPFAEERRLFFVGITRCKIKTYLLVPFKNSSCFIQEIKKLL